MAVGPVTLSAGLKVKSLLVDEPVDKPVFVRRSEDDLRAIRSLEPQRNLVLFTPVIAPPFPLQPGERPTDPFEPLGRALNRHHPRIQHVPFVPCIGATEIHSAFLKQAGATVVVVCKPPGTGSRGMNVLDQISFAKSILHQADSHDGDAAVSSRKRMPSLILLVINDDRLQYMMQEIALFETVLHCAPYTSDALQHAADKIFDQPAAVGVDRAH